MIETVSPIYEDSYAGCWLFEDIGREWDRIWEIIDELPDQLFPQTATWLLGLWERRYGITPNTGDTIDIRRRRIEEIEAYPKPFTPWALDRWVNITSGRNAVVQDNIAPYTFGVCISLHPDSGPISADAVIKYINEHKHSHMSYELVFQSEAIIGIRSETGYWRFGYEMSGTKPYRNVGFGEDERQIVVTSSPRAYVFDYSFAGTEETGILPCVNTTGRIERSGIVAESSGTEHPFHYPLSAPDKQTGTLPDIHIVGGIERQRLVAAPEGTGYPFAYDQAGTKPYSSVSFGAGERQITVVSDQDGHAYSSPFAGVSASGQLPGTSTAGRVDHRRVDVSTGGTEYPFRYQTASADEHSGTIPAIRVSGAMEKQHIVSGSDGTGYKLSYLPCGVTNAGRGLL